MKKQNLNKNNGFSLIELSIVLIIMGLLIAGIVGGQSLIESGKTRGIINEIENIKRSVNAYYVAKGRLPGDPNNTGIISGPWLSSFPSDYNFTTNYAQNVTAENAAFYEMNKEGIFEYDVDTEEYKNNNENNETKKQHVSKIVKNAYYQFAYLEPIDNDGLFDNLTNKNLLDFNINYANPSLKMIKSIDQKMDDGIQKTGNVRGDCYKSNDNSPANLSNNYDEAIICYSLSTALSV